MVGSGRKSGDARRGEIVLVAMPLFARHGYAGTSTDAVARGAGISQPYVVRLFGGKRGLFVAVIDAAFDEIAVLLGHVPRRPTAAERIDDLSDAYRELAGRRDVVLVVQQAISAAIDDAEIRSAVQEHVRAIHKTAWSAAGGDTDRVREFFGLVTLLGTVAAIDVPELLGPDW
jgi:AcrR family transcriptional regulator